MGVRRSPWGANPSDSHLEAELQQRGVFQDLPSLVGQADLIVLTCSLTDATRGMVDRPFLKACKPGVRIINVARGLQSLHLVSLLRHLLCSLAVSHLVWQQSKALSHVLCFEFLLYMFCATGSI